MLASYLHNFIFIKTQKTGGTTVETVFASFCGPEDIVAPLGWSDEMARGNGKPICRNFAATPELEKEMIAAMIRHDGSNRGARKILNFYAHMEAAEIKSKLPPDFWAKALKFTIERHPYEKAVSKAFFKLGPHRSMDQFPHTLEKILDKENYGSIRYYSIENELVVDDIIKLENLRSDLQRIAEKIGVKLPDELPRMKSVTRRDPRPAREILTQEQKDRIYRACKAEFDLLGYEP